jgi:excisionase family DNA binding protein
MHAEEQGRIGISEEEYNMENKGRILLWTVEQAAAALAISPWTVRAYIRQGRMRPVRIGRRVLFEPDECQRFLKVCKKPVEDLTNFKG